MDKNDRILQLIADKIGLQQELSALKALVREMGKELQGWVHFATVMPIHYLPNPLETSGKILSRPEVKAIMGGKMDNNWYKYTVQNINSLETLLTTANQKITELKGRLHEAKELLRDCQSLFTNYDSDCHCEHCQSYEKVQAFLTPTPATQNCTAVCSPKLDHGICDVAHHCTLPQGHTGKHLWPCQDTPATEPKCCPAVQPDGHCPIHSTVYPPVIKPDMVLVRREDLELVLGCHDYGSEDYDQIKPRREAINRLEAALDSKGKL